MVQARFPKDKSATTSMKKETVVNEDDDDDDDDHHHHHHNEEVEPDIWMYSVLAASIPLFWMGNWSMGMCFVGIAILYKVLIPKKKMTWHEKLSIQYNVWSAEDVVHDLARYKTEPTTVTDDNLSLSPPKGTGGSSAGSYKISKHRFAVLTASSSLAKKYNKLQQQLRLTAPTESNGPQMLTPPVNHDHSRDNLALLCQQVAFVGLNSYPDDDQVVDASFALLALVAKIEVVRKRHLQQANPYSITVLIRLMTEALTRAKCVEKDEPFEQKAAELQRKGCLLLGALADGDSILGAHVVQDGGLKAVVDAALWYQYHEKVAQWALWALFILCYDDATNKTKMLDLGGLSVVLRLMKNCPDNIEVARHGVAIIFDLLREDESSKQPPLDIWKIRDTALSYDLHAVLVKAMELSTMNLDNVHIMLMSRELLIGTGYKGKMPDIAHLETG